MRVLLEQVVFSDSILVNSFCCILVNIIININEAYNDFLHYDIIFIIKKILLTTTMDLKCQDVIEV